VRQRGPGAGPRHARRAALLAGLHRGRRLALRARHARSRAAADPRAERQDLPRAAGGWTLLQGGGARGAREHGGVPEAWERGGLRSLCHRGVAPGVSGAAALSFVQFLATLVGVVKRQTSTAYLNPRPSIDEVIAAKAVPSSVMATAA